MSRSAFNNSQWKTIPLNRVGSPAQVDRWNKMVRTLAVERRQQWKTIEKRK
jgi:hypothetical protein